MPAYYPPSRPGHRGEWDAYLCTTDHMCDYLAACVCPAFIFHKAISMYGMMYEDETDAVEARVAAMGPCSRYTHCLCLYPCQSLLSCLCFAPLAFNVATAEEDDYFTQDNAVLALLGCICAPPAACYVRSLTLSHTRSDHIEEPMWKTAMVSCCLWPCSMQQCVDQLAIDGNSLLG